MGWAASRERGRGDKCMHARTAKRVHARMHRYINGTDASPLILSENRQDDAGGDNDIATRCGCAHAYRNTARRGCRGSTARVTQRASRTGVCTCAGCTHSSCRWVGSSPQWHGTDPVGYRGSRRLCSSSRHRSLFSRYLCKVLQCRYWTSL